MQKTGFLYVYTSNEAPINVFFDNLTVITNPSAVLEETHYYTFGLTMKGISYKAIGRPENKYLYNGKELQTGEFTSGSGLEWYDHGARIFDQQIGRWHVVDPLASLYPNKSQYNFVSNNPINRIDPFGLTDYRINDDEIKTINDGHNNVTINVSQKEYDKLLKKFERGGSGMNVT